jgi:4-amino-4-deoxy-L-arabinose transferase-like glycosyltransferase
MASEESLMDVNGHPESNQHRITDKEDTRVLFRRTNFFVLAPPYQDRRYRRPVTRLAPGGVEVDHDRRNAIPSEPVGRRRMAVPDTITRPEQDRSAVFPVMSTLTIPVWLEMILVFIAMAGSFVAHAVNMFYYPHYEQDEGTYLMYAWAFTHGSITNYPYGYGHPPLAWIQIAIWVKLTGGFSTFGTAINSGRVLVLLIVVGSSFLVYQIARKLGLGLSASLLAVAIFSFSPISITFQREVLLDNFATFWFLLALYLIVASKSRMFYIVSAAICLGISLLSKEVLIVFFPVMIYVVWLHTTKFQRTFALVTFIFIVFAAGFSFILMAILKGELFPYSWHLPWDHHPHLSLIDTFIVQTQRGQSLGSFSISWDTWVSGDPLLIFLGIAAPAFNLITGWWNRKSLFLSLLALSFWALLARGGVDFAFYIIPLIPLIALNTVFALKTLTGWFGRFVHLELVGILLILASLVALINYDIQHTTEPINLFTQRPAVVETEALTWIRAQVPRRSVIVIDSNLYTDLHEQEGDGVGDGTTYPHAEVYWNVALDPELEDTLLKGNWDRIDYIVADPGMLHDIETYGGHMDLIKTALEHSILRVEFKGDVGELVQIYQVIHTESPPEV